MPVFVKSHMRGRSVVAAYSRAGRPSALQATKTLRQLMTLKKNKRRPKVMAELAAKLNGANEVLARKRHVGDILLSSSGLQFMHAGRGPAQRKMKRIGGVRASYKGTFV